MIIRNSSGPSRCSQCLLDADEAVRMHLRESRPCSHPGCPLQRIIRAALEHRPTIVFGPVRKPPGIIVGKAYTRSPAMIHILSKKTRFDKFITFIINQFKKLHNYGNLQFRQVSSWIQSRLR